MADTARRHPPLPTSRGGAHIEKPELVYEMIERMHPALLKLELFARGRREGWSALEQSGRPIAGWFVSKGHQGYVTGSIAVLLGR
jgi:N6-adenosine-specific RNA methylase IME4